MNADAEKLCWSDEQIQAWQLERLQETLERAKRAPFFAERLAGARVNSLDDLASLPLTTKEDLRAASPFGSVAVPHSELFQYHESFGTTGGPVSSWLTANDFQEYARQINQCDMNFGPEDMVVNKFPYAISVPAHILKLAAQNRGACVVSASSLTSVCPYTRTLELMAKLRANVLTCLPTEATLLGATAKLMGLDPHRDIQLRAIGAAGELLTDARRRRIEQFWNCKVYNYYGTTETGNLASESNEGQMHLAWDHFLVEVLDPETMEPLPAGSVGMPAVTTLTREAMPLIRYVLTDSIKLETVDSTPSGRRSPIVHHYGRDQGRFAFQDRSVSLAELEDGLFQLPQEVLGDIWMVIVTPDEVVFRVEAERPDPALHRTAEREVGDGLEIPLRIEAVPPGSVFPNWWLMEPARVGKPSYCAHVDSLDQAPKNLPELWLGPGNVIEPPADAGPPPGLH